MRKYAPSETVMYRAAASQFFSQSPVSQSVCETTIFVSSPFMYLSTLSQEKRRATELNIVRSCQTSVAPLYPHESSALFSPALSPLFCRLVAFCHVSVHVRSCEACEYDVFLPMRPLPEWCGVESINGRPHREGSR